MAALTFPSTLANSCGPSRDYLGAALVTSTVIFGTGASNLPAHIDFLSGVDRLMIQHSETALAPVSHQLSKLEKRDWELWGIVSLTGILLSASLLAIVFRAAFLKNDGIHFELTVSRPLARVLASWQASDAF